MPEKKKTFTFLVEGGKATAGPPIGPALGPLGINIGLVVQKINEKTKDFAGMTVPVKVIVDLETKEFEIEVGIPPTSSLIFKELGVEKGAHQPGKEWVGSLTMEQVAKIAYTKWKDLKSNSFKAAVKQVLGTCLSSGVLVEGKNPKEVTKEVDAGVYDDILKKWEEKLRKEGLLRG